MLSPKIKTAFVGDKDNVACAILRKYVTCLRPTKVPRAPILQVAPRKLIEPERFVLHENDVSNVVSRICGFNSALALGAFEAR